ncbi:hypothetical protein Sjap_025915 [Stephania japonica]|uniref:Uncharacterized protein n=1 Tax=Stephania japonica TaxID=461633 RepID=A0AAP0E2M7_9MAGN
MPDHRCCRSSPPHERLSLSLSLSHPLCVSLVLKENLGFMCFFSFKREFRVSNLFILSLVPFTL